MPIIRTGTYVCDICGKELPKDQVKDWLELGPPLVTITTEWSRSWLFCSFGCLKEMIQRIEHSPEVPKNRLKLAVWEGKSFYDVEEKIGASIQDAALPHYDDGRG